MKKIRFIYTERDHRWGIIARDPEKPIYMIDTNECLIIHGEEGLLTDPGGMEIFPSVFSAISSSFNVKNIKTIFSSHQDPDIISSLTLWLEVNPELKCYISRLWSTFVPHFGGDNKTLIPIPDEGGILTLDTLRLKMIPAHYLHSAGNFHLYDQKAKIYFSGDVGAALLSGVEDIYVKNFDEHIEHARGFHERWMGSNEARLDWCQRVSELEIDTLVPQHGSIYQGKDVERFINWFSELKVGLFAQTWAEENPEAAEKKLFETKETTEDVLEEEPQDNALSKEPEVDSEDGNENSDLEALMNQGSSADKDDAAKKSNGQKSSFFSKVKAFFTGKRNG